MAQCGRSVIIISHIDRIMMHWRKLLRLTLLDLEECDHKIYMKKTFFFMQIHTSQEDAQINVCSKQKYKQSHISIQHAQIRRCNNSFDASVQKVEDIRHNTFSGLLLRHFLVSGLSDTSSSISSTTVILEETPICRKSRGY